MDFQYEEKSMSHTAEEIDKAVDQSATNANDIYALKEYAFQIIQNDLNNLKQNKADTETVEELKQEISELGQDAENKYTKSEVDEKLNDKVEKIEGKGLSTNDFSDEYKNKVDKNTEDLENTYRKSEVEKKNEELLKKIAENVEITNTNSETLAELQQEKTKNEILEKSQNSNTLMAGFFNADKNFKVSFFKSLDGVIWKKLNIPQFPNLRDADIVFKNGAFLMTGTINNRVNELSIFRSYNLIDWEDKSQSFGMINTDMVSYAPEWFEDDDGTLYGLICIRDSKADNLYYYKNYIVKCNDIDNLTFDEPVLMDIGNYNCIDPHIIKKDDTYYLFVKTEYTIAEFGQTDGEILIFTSKNLKDWGLKVNGISSLKGYRYEGQSISMIDGTYYLYVDNYGGDDSRDSRSYMHYCTSSDLLSWSEPKMIFANPSTRHGTPRMISDPAADRILSRFHVEDDGVVTYKECMKLNTAENDCLKIYTITPTGPYRNVEIDFSVFDSDNLRLTAEYKVIVNYYTSVTDNNVMIYENVLRGEKNKFVYAQIEADGTVNVYLRIRYGYMRPIVKTNAISNFACDVKQIYSNEIFDFSTMTLKSPGFFTAQDNRLRNFYPGVLNGSTFSTSQLECSKILNLSTGSNNALKIELNGIYYMTFNMLVFGRANGMVVDAFVLIAQMTSDGTYANSNILKLGEKDHTITTDGRNLTLNGLSGNGEYTCIVHCSHGDAYKLSLIKSE